MKPLGRKLLFDLKHNIKILSLQPLYPKVIYFNAYVNSTHGTEIENRYITLLTCQWSYVFLALTHRCILNDNAYETNKKNAYKTDMIETFSTSTYSEINAMEATWTCSRPTNYLTDYLKKLYDKNQWITYYSNIFH